MVAAHTKTTATVKSLATQENITAELPKEMDRKHAKMLSDLKSLSGARFDRKYVELQVAAHKEAASTFDSYATKGQNAAFKKFAADTAPVIKTHLDHAQMLGKSVPTSNPTIQTAATRRAIWPGVFVFGAAAKGFLTAA